MHRHRCALALDPAAGNASREIHDRIHDVVAERFRLFGQAVEGGQANALDPDELAELVPGAARDDRDHGDPRHQPRDRLAGALADAGELRSGHDRTQGAVEVEQHAGAPGDATEPRSGSITGNPSVRAGEGYTRHP